MITVRTDAQPDPEENIITELDRPLPEPGTITRCLSVRLPDTLRMDVQPEPEGGWGAGENPEEPQPVVLEREIGLTTKIPAGQE